MKRLKLEYSEYKRPIVWLAEWFSVGAYGQCLFASRAEAISWAKFNALGYIDWESWQPDDSAYPNELHRDKEGFAPTFRATWNSGRVQVTRLEVCDKFDWAANKSWDKGKALNAFR